MMLFEKFTKIFASRAEDKNVRNYMLFADEDKNLFLDAKAEVKATADEVAMMFKKGVVVKFDDAEFKPVKCVEDDGVVTLVCVDYASSALAAVEFKSQVRE